jgi:hypothetical protein
MRRMHGGSEVLRVSIGMLSKNGYGKDIAKLGLLPFSLMQGNIIGC